MIVRPTSFYGDPAKAFEREQERTCLGCAWETRTDGGLPRCGRGNRYGRRCVSYKEKQGRTDP